MATDGSMTRSHEGRLAGERWTSALAVAAYFALAKLLIHFLTSGRYGYFRDELYYLACGEHLDWGYVDHAPLVGLVARLSRELFGDSLFAIRLFPALAGALKVLLTGLIARELGGRRLAVALACLCVLIAPVYLVADYLLSMNAFEPLFWMGAAYAIILVIKRQEPRYWLLFGLLAGLGLENKHSMLFFGFGIFVGLLVTPARRALFSKWFWLGGALAASIFLPNLIWEYRHDWATIELLANVGKTGKNVRLSPLEFVGQQILIMHPLTAPVWLAGLWFLLFDGAGRRYRPLGVAYLVVLSMLILLKGKNYYLQPVYPMLFAGGGVLFERLCGRRYFGWLKIAYPLLLLIGGALLAPLALPLLPVETFLQYERALGIEPPKTEVGHQGALPQHFGDQFGWPEMVAEVARIYHSLPPEERARAGIYANNYGEAGAIDFFGSRYGLPKAVSPHQSYFLWGPRGVTGEVLILLQSKRADAERLCSSVEEAAVLNHPYAMAEERYRIFICRDLKRPLAEIWPKLKHWN
ncbi:MAG: glycosyltransferase family 39 protein [Pyrinomonadaceae bacterium]